MPESFFKTIKHEWLYRFKFNSYSQLYDRTSDHIRWYNSKRICSTLGYLSPLQRKMKLRAFINKAV